MFNLMMVMLQTSFFHAVSLSTESPPFGSSRYHGKAISLSRDSLSLRSLLITGDRHCKPPPTQTLRSVP